MSCSGPHVLFTAVNNNVSDRTVSSAAQVLARLWRHSSGGAIHKLATCSRLPPPDSAPGPHVIVAAGRNEAAIWDLSKGGACKQVRSKVAIQRMCLRNRSCDLLGFTFARAGGAPTRCEGKGRDTSNLASRNRGLRRVRLDYLRFLVSACRSLFLHPSPLTMPSLLRHSRHRSTADIACPPISSLPSPPLSSPLLSSRLGSAFASWPRQKGPCRQCQCRLRAEAAAAATAAGDRTRPRCQGPSCRCWRR